MFTRRNVEKQEEDYRYIWETIIAAKEKVPVFLLKHGLWQYKSSLTEFEKDDVEDLLDAEIKTGERIANIPHRMKSIISSADEAARTSNRFLGACRDSVNRARALEAETRAAARQARQGQITTDHSTAATAATAATTVTAGAGAILFGAAVLATGGLAAVAGAAVVVAGAGAVGTGLEMGMGVLLTAATDLVSSLAISSDAFKNKLGNLEDQQRNMGEKARELERLWLNENHTCVTMMESDNAAAKHKLVVLPSYVQSVTH
ncbi:Hypp269 [Branchiostoma lanceolatum]|uniref:Hypp269 protein n=1 Tax=Branchiostoma lanceolatum TaxID=7740 RepID=A0A8J9VTP5_BRALA|nr:Hypp269 [Branchiostoma lanceolatum]